MTAFSSADHIGALSRQALKVQSWWLALAHRRRISRTAHILDGLDDRTLRDIGLNRSEIASYARHGSFERRSRMTVVN